MKQLKNKWLAIKSILTADNYFLMFNEDKHLHWITDYPTDSKVIKDFDRLTEYSVKTNEIERQLKEILH